MVSLNRVGAYVSQVLHRQQQRQNYENLGDLRALCGEKGYRHAHSEDHTLLSGKDTRNVQERLELTPWRSCVESHVHTNG